MGAGAHLVRHPGSPSFSFSEPEIAAAARNFMARPRAGAGEHGGVHSGFASTAANRFRVGGITLADLAAPRPGAAPTRPRAAGGSPRARARPGEAHGRPESKVKARTAQRNKAGETAA